MDVHNISYLHDDNAPQDTMPENQSGGRTNFLTRKNIVIASIIGIFLLSTTVITLNINKSQNTQSDAKGQTQSGPTPTGKPVIVEGTLQCLENSQKTNPRCELALKTDDGKTYIIEDSDNAKNLTVGQRVKIEGDAIVGPTTILTNTSKTTIKVQSVQSPSSTTTSNNPTPTTSSQSNNDTPQPTATPTPTPQLKNNTPNPGVEYVTVKYVVDNKNSLSGQNVNVSAFLVGGYIGRPGCNFEPDCEKSLFILNDTASTDRDASYDVGLRGGTTDQEGDYAPGQKYYTTAKVIVSGDTVSLEKIN